MRGERFDDVSLVVRESGERTSEACCRLLADMFGGPVHRVSGRPFSMTLRRSLACGARLDRPWTLCVDADVLVLPGMKTLVAEARALPDRTFVAQALVVDKLLPVRRPAGNHLYRTKHIDAALSLIPDDDVLRPESDMILRMRERGFGFHQSRTVVGLHDFEQSSADLFAKAYLHGHKHRSFKDELLLIWGTLAATDPDYEVALAAWQKAEADQASPRVCRDFTDSLMQNPELTLASKPELAPLAMEQVEAMLASSAASDSRIEPWRTRLQSRIDAVVFPDPPSRAPSLARAMRHWRAYWQRARSMIGFKS